MTQTAKKIADEVNNTPQNPFAAFRTADEIVTPDVSRISAGAQAIRESFSLEDREKIKNAKILKYDSTTAKTSTVVNLNPSAEDALYKLSNKSRTPATIDLAVLLAGLERGKTEDLALSEFVGCMHKLFPAQSKTWFQNLRKAVHNILQSGVRAEAKGGKTNVVGLDSFMDQVKYATNQIVQVNSQFASPVFYQFGSKISTMESQGDKDGEIKQLSLPEFVARLNVIAPFSKPFGETGFIGVSAPQDVCTQVFYHPYLKLPEIDRIVRAPVFMANGELITRDGYHENHKLYLAKPRNMYFDSLPKTISPEMLEDAVNLLTSLFADFYLDGVSRAELKGAQTGQGAKEDGMLYKRVRQRWGSCEYKGAVGTPVPPSFLHCIGFMLEQPVRAMIDGPLMPSLISKTVEGAGGGLLLKVMMTIIQGGGAPQVLSLREDERVKAIYGMLAAGANVVGYDNLPKGVKIDSKGLATLTTEPEWTDRTLGKSEQRTFKVTNSLAFVGVNPLFSKELVRRMSGVFMVPQTSSPETREDFEHADLLAHVRASRSEYINALLVLVKNWIDKGRPAPKYAPTVGSYGNYRKVIAGILEAASPHWTSWQCNRHVLNEVAKDDDEDDGAESFFENWAKRFGIGKPVESSKLCDMALAEKIALPVKRSTDGSSEYDYSPKGMGKFLAGMQGRFFRIEYDGGEHEVQPVRSDKRGDTGKPWVLKVQTKPIQK